MAIREEENKKGILRQEDHHYKRKNVHFASVNEIREDSRAPDYWRERDEEYYDSYEDKTPKDLLGIWEKELLAEIKDLLKNDIRDNKTQKDLLIHKLQELNEIRPTALKIVRNFDEPQGFKKESGGGHGQLADILQDNPYGLKDVIFYKEKLQDRHKDSLEDKEVKNLINKVLYLDARSSDSVIQEAVREGLKEAKKLGKEKIFILNIWEKNDLGGGCEQLRHAITADFELLCEMTGEDYAKEFYKEKYADSVRRATEILANKNSITRNEILTINNGLIYATFLDKLESPSDQQGNLDKTSYKYRVIKDIIETADNQQLSQLLNNNAELLKEFNQVIAKEIITAAEQGHKELKTTMQQYITDKEYKADGKTMKGKGFNADDVLDAINQNNKLSDKAKQTFAKFTSKKPALAQFVASVCVNTGIIRSPKCGVMTRVVKVFRNNKVGIMNSNSSSLPNANDDQNRKR